MTQKNLATSSASYLLLRFVVARGAHDPVSPLPNGLHRIVLGIHISNNCDELLHEFLAREQKDITMDVHVIFVI